MRHTLRVTISSTLIVGIVSGWNLLVAAGAHAAEPRFPVVLDDESEFLPPDVIGPASALYPARAVQDTAWYADWTFDAPIGGCIDAGWARVDGRNLNDGSNYWHISDAFDGQGGITGNAAVLSKHDLCWANDGYGHDWDYAIVLPYGGSGCLLSLRYLADTEGGYDFISISADSGGAAESRARHSGGWRDSPDNYRTVLLTESGSGLSGQVDSMPLPTFNALGVTHQVFVRFQSDSGFDDEDGQYGTALHAGFVVDSIQVTGGTTYAEDFEDGRLDPPAEFRNTAVNMSIGRFARLYWHPSDNDKCTENTSCAWIWTDAALQTCDPTQQYGPGGQGVRRYLDDMIVSPWVSYPAVSSSFPVLSYRRFGGNTFGNSCIVQGWAVRSRYRVDNTETPSPGDSIWCATPWAHASSFNTLSSFTWITRVEDLSQWIDSRAVDVQIRFRVTDWSFVAQCFSFQPDCYTGPGPYLDRIRLGHTAATTQLRLAVPLNQSSDAQDAFPAARNATPGAERFQPTNDIFGTIPFSSAATPGETFPLDSITVQVLNANPAIPTSVVWYGAIVSGPHAGRAPAPYVAGPDGLFSVLADSCRDASGRAQPGFFFLDLDDTYLRGGDRLLSCWTASSADGAFVSDPPGLTAPPVSVADAEQRTSGWLEFSALPTIDWAPSYLARIAADAHGDLDPTPEEIAASSPTACILYSQMVNVRRRSSDAQRTHFMYTLDVLGYEGLYDVYDQRLGATDRIATRATIAQTSHYAMLIQDMGRIRNAATVTLPPDQSQWYRDWLAGAAASRPGQHTLWLLAENLRENLPSSSVVNQEMGVSLAATTQVSGANPRVVSQSGFTFQDGAFYGVGDDWQLMSLCGSLADYDGLVANGSAVVTHAYSDGHAPGLGAVVMNANAAAHWNTIYMSFNWADAAPLIRPSQLLQSILPPQCRAPYPPVAVEDRELLPARSRICAVSPNPFNPTVAIQFDLARPSRVQLQIFAVDGTIVRTLLDEERAAATGARVTWDGSDNTGAPVASGVYLIRFTASGVSETRRIVLLK